METFSFEIQTYAIESLGTDLSSPKVAICNLEAIMEAELATQPIFLDSEPIHTGRKRKAKDMSGLSVCLCGKNAKPNYIGSI